MIKESKPTRAPGEIDASATPVGRVMGLLEHLASGGSTANLAEASRRLGINRITLMRLLESLEDERVIERVAAGDGHRLGARLFGLAATAFASRDVLALTPPVLKHLAATLKGSAYFGVLDGADVLYLLREMPNTPLVSYVKVGARLPAPSTSTGRVMLANQPGAPTGGSPTPKRLEHDAAFLKRLAEARRHGCDWSLGSFEPSIHSCAAAIFDNTGAVVGSISVNGPATQFGATKTERRVIETVLKDATAELSAGLGYVRSSRDAGTG